MCIDVKTNTNSKKEKWNFTVRKLVNRKDLFSEEIIF